jgi:hypothetical protein
MNIHRRKSTYESEGNPEQKFDAASIIKVIKKHMGIAHVQKVLI